ALRSGGGGQVDVELAEVVVAGTGCLQRREGRKRDGHWFDPLGRDDVVSLATWPGGTRPPEGEEAVSLDAWGQSTSCSARARATAWVRLWTPSLPYRWIRWVLTVLGSTNSSSRLPALERPDASRRPTVVGTTCALAQATAA